MACRPQTVNCGYKKARVTRSNYRMRTWLPLCALIAAGCMLAATTYSVFGHTWDEPEHLAAGIALLDTGAYPYDTQHPPLARVFMALGPYLAGAHSHGNAGPSGEEEGRDILYDEGHYDQYLTLARVGMLPFLVLLLTVVWLWTRQSFGERTALLATALVVTTPIVIGHAAVAALDLPMVSTTMLALYLFACWLRQPSLWRAVALGIGAGLAVATKLSALPFLGCAALLWYAAWVGSSKPIAATTQLRDAATATIVAAIMLVACYGFNIARPIDSFGALFTHNSDGHLSFFNGELRRTGWWDFYLVAMAVKTPLPLLILGLGGSGWLLLDAYRRKTWWPAAPVLAWTSILLFASAVSRINIGVRHVLILYPLLAVCGAAFAVALWRRRAHWLVRPTLALLLGWQVVGMAAAHPDYLAYFNELGGAHPERVLVDSDLDWGQDLRRLKQALHDRKIDRISIVYRGSADLDREQIPAKFTRLWPGQRATGWIAVFALAKATEESHGYDWLNELQPVARIGKSVDLYFVQEAVSK
jgi:hypothetical protein